MYNKSLLQILLSNFPSLHHLQQNTFSFDKDFCILRLIWLCSCFLSFQSSFRLPKLHPSILSSFILSFLPTFLPSFQSLILFPSLISFIVASPPYILRFLCFLSYAKYICVQLPYPSFPNIFTRSESWYFHSVTPAALCAGIAMYIFWTCFGFNFNKSATKHCVKYNSLFLLSPLISPPPPVPPFHFQTFFFSFPS